MRLLPAVLPLLGLLFPSGLLAAGEKSQALQPPRIIETPAVQAPTPAPSPVSTPEVLFFGPERIFPKDPHAALCFSLVCPGLGHLYTESYGRGFAALAVFAGGVGFLANNGRMVHDPQTMSDSKMRNATAFQIGAPLVLAWYLLAAHDARSQARRYNQKLGFRFAVTARGPSAEFRF